MPSKIYPSVLFTCKMSAQLQTSRSNPVSDKASLQTFEFLKSLTQNVSAPASSIEKQISVLKTALRASKARRRKTRHIIKAKTIELQQQNESILETESKIKALESMKDPDSDTEVEEMDLR